MFQKRGLVSVLICIIVLGLLAGAVQADRCGCGCGNGHCRGHFPPECKHHEEEGSYILYLPFVAGHPPECDWPTGWFCDPH